MKIYSLTKKEILTSMAAFLLAATAITLGTTTLSKAVTTAAEPREIPVYSVDTEEKKVSISFDAAWGNEQTAELLDILDRYNVKTTFFLVGQWVDNYPDSVKDIAKRGHDVENHSDTHAHLPQLSNADKEKEITNCNEKIKSLTGKSPTLFRPPYGDYDNDTVKEVKSLGMYCTQWSIDSLDWKDLSPQEITRRVTKNLQNGDIILLHNGAKNTPAALPQIIEEIQAQGFEIVKMTELIPTGDYTTDHTGKMYLSESD
ncbi:MAG: polysaccharide deacetylase family protein [Clostridia bacterium]|nr:polysaccharide deacetylase family protein [Clostridia bacterium]